MTARKIRDRLRFERSINSDCQIMQAQLHIAMALNIAVQARIEGCYARARRSWPQLQTTLPQVSYDLQGVAAGMAIYRDQRLRFNAVLLVENPPAFIRDTVAHEVAHLIAHTLSPYAQPHGVEWRMWMERFGAEATRCHAYDLSTVRPIVYHYRCACRVHALTPRRHAAASKRRRYHCRSCKQRLVFETQFRVTG